MDSLDEFMKTNKLTELFQKRKENNENIIKYNYFVKKLRIKNRAIEKEIWTKCSHSWGPKSSYDDLCNRQCKICGLYNNHYFYT